VTILLTIFFSEGEGGVKCPLFYLNSSLIQIMLLPLILSKFLIYTNFRKTEMGVKMWFAKGGCLVLLFYEDICWGGRGEKLFLIEEMAGMCFCPFPG